MKKHLLTFTILFLTLTFQAMSQETKPPADPDLAAFQLDSLIAEMDESRRPWLPFMKGENVLTGLYRLKAGSEDKQRPHDTDEVYYVVSGKAQFIAGGETVAVKPGSVLFVKAEVEHRFFEIEEDLVLIVFFDQ